LIEIGSKTAQKNSAQTDRHYKNNGHLAVNQKYPLLDTQYHIVDGNTTYTQ